MMIRVRLSLAVLIAGAAAFAGPGAVGAEDAFRVAQNRPAPARPAPTQAQTPAAAPQQPQQQQGQQTQQAQPQQQQQPPAPTPTRTEILNLDNWVVTCREFAEGKRKRICSALLQITQSGTNNIVLAWTMGQDDENRMTSVLQTPTGVLIAPGAELRLGKAAPRKLAYTMCDNGRCTVTSPVDNTLVRDITAAGEAEVVIQAANGSNVQFKFPLKGFDRAYAEISR